VLADTAGVTPVLLIGGAAVVVASVAGRILIGPFATRPPNPYEPVIARITALPLFAGVSRARVETAMQSLRPTRVDPGDVVIREGDVADRFYVIAEGRVRITQRAPDGSDRVLREQGPDEVFGEIGLLRSSPRTATVTAIEPGLLLALDRDEFLALVGADARLGTRLLDLHRGSAIAELRTERAVSAS